MQTGIYEQLITKAVKKRIDELPESAFFHQKSLIPTSDAAVYLSRHIARWVEYALKEVIEEDNSDKQLVLANKILTLLINELNDTELGGELIENECALLEAVISKLDFPYSDITDRLKQITPLSRLSQSELFTGNRAGISMESEIRKEIASSDDICWLVSFIKFSGIRIFKDELTEFTRQEGKKLRIITTTYMGASDAKAIEFLAQLPNTEIKISYNAEHERLHAKAYLFLRNTGYHTGYIGSSNISRSALTSGLEWNLKITTQEIPHIIDKFQKTFETYWNDPEFVLFQYPNDVKKLRDALSQESSRDGNVSLTFFDLKPYPFQQEILDRLTAERDLHHRYRNLVVAATGTGKTIVSAFDFQRFRLANPGCKLLFVAHRKEILAQARTTFRHILKDGNFGELMVDGMEPTNFEALFASIQTLSRRLKDMALSPNFFDFIIIDEVHHLTANSYRPLLESFRPKIFLGLTATPERMDGGDILEDFDDHIGAEIRLPEALNRKLLTPFQYFGITDSVDLDQVQWTNGRYDAGELTRLYTKPDQRVTEIIHNCNLYLTDPYKVRALCFCVTKEHARFMAEKFTLAGFQANYLTSETDPDLRKQLREQLQKGKLNYLFVIDIFNEGVDIPEIDTVLFLRPTESLTVFLQQLGRGLRLSPGKEVLTILDFVGNARAEYDFESKFRSLVGRTHTSVKQEIENNFPHLPLGCTIVLEKQAREYILQNIQQATDVRRLKLISLIRTFSRDTSLELTLKNFLRIHHFDIRQIYQRAPFITLCAEAGVVPTFDEPHQDQLSKFIQKRLPVIQSSNYLAFISKLIKNGMRWNSSSIEESKLALMFYYDVFNTSGTKNGFNNLNDALHSLKNSPTLLKEIVDASEYLLDKIEVIAKPVEFSKDFPLHVHGRYLRDHIVIALEKTTFEHKYPSREGLLYSESLNTEALFVTLDKSSLHYTPNTRYDDYAINEFLFHWQSQNSASPETRSGKNYIHHLENGRRILLFVREANRDEFRLTSSFVFLGEVNIEQYYGAKPMNITWSLSEPIPSYLLLESKKLAAG
jgi:superfamily II DNA or RNA helicase/HKD family nuclease